MAQFQVTLTRSISHVVTVEAENEASAEFVAFKAVHANDYTLAGVIAHSEGRDDITTNYTNALD